MIQNDREEEIEKGVELFRQLREEATRKLGRGESLTPAEMSLVQSFVLAEDLLSDVRGKQLPKTSSLVLL